MKKMVICLTCLVALIAATIAISYAQGGQNNYSVLNSTILNSTNMTNNATGPSLRVGYETVAPVSNLDRFGNKSAYNIEAYSQNKLLFNASNATPVQPMLNVSQRSEVPPTVTYNTGQTEPMVSVNASPSVSVYNIANYPPIMMGTPIP